MSKSMLVNVTAEEEHRVAIVDSGVLDAFEIETLSREHLKGDFFKGIVDGVNPALEAAFVNYGGERAGFLPLDEVNFKLYPSRNGGGRGRGGRIARHLEKGMEVLVQVIRDSFANKPPTLSTYYSLPGRYLVLMPGADSGGISRKIDDEEHRERLRRIVDELEVPEGYGVIVRTAGMETSLEELRADLSSLLELWRTIDQASQQVKAPALIFQDHDLVIRTLRDYYTADIEEVLIDDAPTHRRARKFFETYIPDRVHVVKQYTGDRPIFSKFNVEEQIERIYKRVVQLKSGGSISIDQTEALTAIDVNSSRSVRSANSEDTALKTNLEAAEEIARQLRLRDIGGLIVIDFIDMEATRHARRVERAFAEAMSHDKARYDVTRISKLGLMEVSRQRIKASKASSTFATCPTCSGDGTIRTAEASARAAFRKIQARVVRGGIVGVQVYLPPEVANYLLNKKRDDLVRIETRHGVRIEVTPEQRLKPHQFEIEEIRDTEPETIPVVTAEQVEQVVAAGGSSRTDRAADLSEAAPGGEAPGTRKKRRRRRRRRGRSEEAGVAEPERDREPARDPGPREPAFSEAPEATPGPALEPEAPAEGVAALPRLSELPAPEASLRPRRRRRRRRRGRRSTRGAGRADAPEEPRAGRAVLGRAGGPAAMVHPSGDGGRRAPDSRPRAAQSARAAAPAEPPRFADQEAPADQPRESTSAEQRPGETGKTKRSWWRRAFRG